MKKIYAIATFFLIIISADSQILKRLTDHAKQKAEQKANEKIDKSIDDAASDKKKNEGKPGSAPPSETKNTETGVVNNSNTEGPATLKTYSKFDFIPGDKVVAVDDFAQDNIGDYPVKWNTNSTGEVVTASNLQGHWLMVRKPGRFIPEYIRNLPDNFTFEYDVICNEKFSFYSPALQVYFLTGNNGKEMLEYSFIPLEKRSGIKIGVHPTNAGNTGGMATFENFEDGASVIKNQVNTVQFNSHVEGKTKLHVSVWRQQQRMRVYLNEEKIFDLPRAFPANKTYSAAMFELWGDMNNEQDRYLFGNLKLSVGAPDTRNKLITEGKFVTRGILFDVNSAVIKPQSYGILNDIANALKENTGVKIKIIGHTDSDGDDVKNMSLSKERAVAVKVALVQEFGVDESRIQTDGKGESQPVDTNGTPEGRANNRRVEFVKM